MKLKIIQALKTKYKHLGFSDNAFESVAAFLEPTISEEEQIDNSIAGVESLLKGFQGEVDNRVTTALKKAKQEPTQSQQQGGGNNSTIEPDKTPDNNDLIQSLLKKVEALEQGKTFENRTKVVESKIGNVPPSIKNTILNNFSRMNFNDDEQFNQYLLQLEGDITTIAEEFKVQTTKSNSYIPMVSGNSNPAQTVIDSEISEWAKNN